MSRVARVESPTGYYHILVRGNNRSYIFKNQRHKVAFMEMIEEQEKDTGMELAAWCIMDNHVHLVIKAELDQLSLAMKRINIKFAMMYNQDQNMVGHVFQDRFKSHVIDSDEYLLQVIRYVHNNPVSAKIEKNPGDYKWSSYREYFTKAGVGKRNQFKFVMELFNNSMDSFKEFHNIEDNSEYLEIKEDLERMRGEKAQAIISECFSRHDISEKIQIEGNNWIKDELIGDLIRKSGLSYRAISRLLELPYSSVREVGKDIQG
jgi:REP element-mobilizing transposase RayT